MLLEYRNYPTILYFSYLVAVKLCIKVSFVCLGSNFIPLERLKDTDGNDENYLFCVSSPYKQFSWNELSTYSREICALFYIYDFVVIL